jgi:transposase
MKYALEFKLKCIELYKKSNSFDYPDGLNKADFRHYVYRWVKQYDDFGIDGLIHQNNNKKWALDERFELVAKVFAGQSISSVSKEANINPGQLYHWVKIYREKGIDGLECRKGRPTEVPDMPNKKKVKLAPSEKEELELLRARNEYLEAENIYLKKLDALVTQREAAHPKAKKQKSSKK